MKVSNLLAFFCFFSFCASLSAQPSIAYLNGFQLGNGEGENDEVNVLKTDSLGNVYVYGTYAGAIDFAPDSSRRLGFSRGSSDEDLWLAKYDSNFQLIWINFIDTRSSCNARDMELDASGQVLICGDYTNSLQPDPNDPQSRIFSNVPTESNGFFARYDGATGQFLWANNLGSDDTDNVLGLAVDEQNQVYISGGFSDTIDFDPGPGVFQRVPTGTFQDPYLAKYDSNGQFIWAQTFEGSGLPGNAFALERAGNGNLLIAGTFSGTVDFDASAAVNSITSNGGDDLFVAEYRPDGQFVQAFPVGGFSLDGFGDMKIGPKDEILLSGFFSFSADFDPGPGTFSLSSQGNDDAFVASYDSSGSFQWALGLGSTSNDVGRALAVDEQGQVFVSGYFLNQVDFDPGPGTAILDGVGGDAFVAAYDSAGSYQWAEKLGGTRFDVGQALALGPDSLLLNGGRFIGMVDLDPGPGLFPVQDFDNNGSSYVVGLDKNSGSFRKGFATEDQRGGDDDARALLSGSQGNYFLGGSFSGEVDFDPGGGAAFLDGAGHRGGFIAKYDSLDQLLWAKAFVSTDFAWVEALAQDAYGNLLACGQFQGRVDFDPGADSLFLSSTPGFISRPDLFILKLDPQGNLLWARSLGGSDFEAAYDLVVDGKQDVLVTGYFRQTVDFDPGPGTASLSGSNRDAFVLKLDSAGLYQWAFQLGGSSNDYGYALEVDSLDNFYVGGSFRNTADFDPSANSSNQTSAGIEDGFVGKYDENGSLIWVRTYGGTFSDEVWALEMEGEKLYVAGAFEDSVSFGVGPGKRSNGDQDVFLLQADAQGNSRWVQSFGGSLPFRDDVPYALAVSQGQLYLAGQYTDTTDFDPGPGQRLLTTSLDRGAFISVFDTSGLFVDAAVYEAPLARDLALNNGQVLLCGNYRGAIDLAPGPIIQPAIPFGDDDLYLIRLGDPPPCNGGRDTLQITQCGPYQGPSGRIYPSSGVFNDTLPIGINCDSIFRLELTLLPTFRDTIPVTACDSFTWQNGLTYLQSGIYFDTLRTVAGCDSIVTLDLRINASARSSEQVTACDSFTWQNGFTYQQSGIYFDTLSTVAGCDSIVDPRPEAQRQCAQQRASHGLRQLHLAEWPHLPAERHLFRHPEHGGWLRLISYPRSEPCTHRHQPGPGAGYPDLPGDGAHVPVDRLQ
jgi:hypothetical protein